MPGNIISKQEVEKVAELARIALSDEEKEKFAKELNSILDYFKDLGEVETTGGEKFDHYKLGSNQFRKDELDEASDDEKEAMRKLFPDRKGDQLKVKEVLSNGD